MSPKRLVGLVALALAEIPLAVIPLAVIPLAVIPLALNTMGAPPAQAATPPAGEGAVPGEMLVGFRPRITGPARAAIHRRHGAQVLQQFPQIGVELIRLPSGASEGAAEAAYRSEKGVAYAEPNYVLRASATTNDPFFNQQWGLSNTGQTVNGDSGTPGDDISATRAWDIQTGSPSVTVAVIDTGVDTGHPDLAANVDTGDAFNFLDNTSVVYDPGETCGTGPNDDHGTHVAGILGAVGNNNTGVAGVAWRVKILPLKFLGVQGTGSTAQCGVGDDAHAIQAIFYAIQKGAQLINISWGGETMPNESLRAAMIQAGQAGVLFSVAAGNAGANLSSATDYPGSFNLSNEIVVAASDSTDHLASFSNFGGPTALAAPGTNILSTVTRVHSPQVYGYLDGTSMAAPFVTGALALLRSQYPSASPAELKSRLLSRVDPRGSLSAGLTASGGRLNVFRALNQDLPVVPTLQGPAGGETYGPGTAQTATWRTNVPAGNTLSGYRVEFTGDALASSTYTENFNASTVPPNFTQPIDSDKGWAVDPGQGPGGSNALRSQLVPADNDKEAWVATTVKLSVPGTVSFSFRVSSEDCSTPQNPTCGDYFQFFVDGNGLKMANGVHPYQPVSFPIAPGTHTLSWSYEKDGSCPVPASDPACTPFQSVADAAWIAGLSVTGIDSSQWTAVATTGPGATSATWTVPSQPTRVAKLRVCQDTGNPCDPAAASTTPGAFAITLILVEPGGLSLTEGGAAASYSVSLLTPPTATVTINLRADPQLQLSTNTLVFNAAGAPESVSVAAPDDLVAQASPHTVSIQQAVSSADPTYSSTIAPTVPVAITDADKASVVVNDGGGITLVPGGGPGSYSVVLTSKPQSPVTVLTVPDSPVLTTPSSLTFDAGNWSVPQTVQVGVTAAGPSFARDAAVANRVSSADPAYNGAGAAAARIHILASPASGYWLIASDGGIFSFGNAHFLGSTGSTHLNKPIVAAMATPSGAGYWLVASDGGIFAFGDAHFFGSTGSTHLNQPIVAAMSTPSGAGYWLVASDGGIFAFGDAYFFGSTGSTHLNQPIVAAMATPTGAGYWLVASDGGIFAFGDAHFFGSTGSTHLNQPIVAAMATPSGAGYWLVASDGGIFAFGDAHFFGSTGSIHLNQAIVAAISPPSGAGYWLVASDGGIFAFGDATFFGSTGSLHLNKPIVAALGR